MSLLLAGIILWFVAHSFPATAPARRDALVAKLGEKPYRGGFALVILASLLMIVFGWKAAVPSALYLPPMGPGIVPSVLVLIGLVLFFASQMNGHISRVLRHPQMTGTVIWAVAHLLTNGDSRSVTLFGSMAVWALFEIVIINRRDGQGRDGIRIGQVRPHRRGGWGHRFCARRTLPPGALRRRTYPGITYIFQKVTGPQLPSSGVHQQTSEKTHRSVS